MQFRTPLLTLVLCGLAAGFAPAKPPAEHAGPREPAVAVTPEERAGEDARATSRIDVVFVLDTTGSMGGLIEGAKQKIWSIANRVATAEPRPEVRMGLLAYRDRGDEYVTRTTPLTDDLDRVYADLMEFRADGGGDTPESVNQALHEAVTSFEWDAGEAPERHLKLIYLVGDAPPKMEYQDDVKYAESCRLAAERGIIVNTIQCGGMVETTPVWQEIARLAEGEYFAVPQSGGAVAVATPYDEEIATLSAELRSTMIDYGEADVLRAQAQKRELAGAIESEAAPAAMADRAAYATSPAGEKTLYGVQELVRDVEEGRVELGEVPADQLPEPMREMNEAERERFVAEKAAKRKEVLARMAELTGKRGEYIREQTERTAADGGDAFDEKVFEALRAQAAEAGIRYNGG